MRSDAPWTRLLPWLLAFTIAMAFLESAVVIYLRALYYPQGFRFPLEPIGPTVAVTELLREVATLVMLLAPAALIAERRLERFAWFCIGFGVWDLFYYVFLKILLDWPTSLLDWDILFLVPVVWVGPVLAPCIVAVGLVVLGMSLLHQRGQDPGFEPRRWHWTGLLASAGLILFTFIEGPHRHAQRTTEIPVPEGPMDHFLLFGLRDYVPHDYQWGVFVVACLLGGGVILQLIRRPS